MPEPIDSLDPERIRDNLARVRAAAGEGVELLVATKYVSPEDMGPLAEAGASLVGENRLQDLEAKRQRWGDAFRWDFIGAVQSRKAPRIAAGCERIHSIGTRSALARLEATGASEAEILLQVDLSGEASKQGFEADELGELIAATPLAVSGLSIMPPAAERAEDSRPYFARLAGLAAEHGLGQLSMGTTQDWGVAVEEGATVIRLGSGILR